LLKTWKEVVDKDMNGLHLRQSDAVVNGRIWLEGIGVRATVIVMTSAEYKLCISGAGSPR